MTSSCLNQEGTYERVTYCCDKKSKETTSMTRRRSRGRLVLPLTLLLCSLATSAFTTPLHRLARTGAVLSPLKTVSLLDYDDDSIDPTDPSSSWLRWMRGGVKPSNVTAEREPDGLTGIARTDRHSYSSRDWLKTTLGLLDSAILRDIGPPVACLTTWAAFISLVYKRLMIRNPILAQNVCLSTTPHSFMMSALGLLLVFRTNSAYQRFAEGRKIWEDIINSSRDLYRMLMLYDREIGSDKRRRCQKLLAAFPYLLRHRIRPNVGMRRIGDDQFKRDPEFSILLYQDAAAFDNDPEAAAVATEEETTGKSRRKQRTLYWVDKRTLPWRLIPSGALEQCARATNRPLWVADRMATELRTVPDQSGPEGPTFTARERLALISHVDKLSHCIGGCERIHQTVVPLNYARHALRGLTLWLLSLPFALVKDQGYLTGPIVFLVAWLLFGIYEIGYSIEDPFQGTLRLSILCDTIRRDVLEGEYTRGTAFILEPDRDKVSENPNGEQERDSDDSYEASDLKPSADFGKAKEKNKKTNVGTAILLSP